MRRGDSAGEKRGKRLSVCANEHADRDNEMVGNRQQQMLRTVIVPKGAAKASDVPYLGQAGILRNPNNVDELTFVTCKYNLATDLNKQGVLEVCFAPHECILPHGPQYEINIPNTGWRKTPAHAVILRDAIPWGNGYDISLGPVLSGDGASRVFPGDHLKAQWLKEMATEEVEPFDVVSNSFLYERDLKIGMIVYKRGGVIANKDAFSTVEGGVDSIPISNPDSFATVTRGRDQTRVVKVFGEGVMIYTGRITRVCDQHIEYNINTYEGCSGAVVILMERGHPDFGKALAVHAGYRLELGTNLGFKLAGIFDRPFVAAEW